MPESKDGECWRVRVRESEQTMWLSTDLYLANDVPWLNMHSTRTHGLHHTYYRYNFKGRMRVRYVNDALNVNRGLPMECWWYWVSSHQLGVHSILFYICCVRTDSSLSLIKQTHTFYSTPLLLYIFYHVPNFSSRTYFTHAIIPSKSMCASVFYSMLYKNVPPHIHIVQQWQPVLTQNQKL